MADAPCSFEGCTNRQKSRGYCNGHYKQLRAGRPLKKIQLQVRGSVAERLAAHTNRTASCWIWVGARTPLQYGAINVGGKRELAHRVAYELSSGHIPKGAVIDHKCHNPSCVRPGHLQAVTQKQNVENMSRLRPDNISGARGVSWSSARNLWNASVCHNGRHHNLGFYDTVSEAEGVAKAKRLELFTNNLKDLEHAK